jgi:hypothetical protein
MRCVSRKEGQFVHSRIYQITTAPVKKEDYISEHDFFDHWFTDSIADYVSGDVDRAADIKWLRDGLADIAAFSTFDSFVIVPRGREAYFTRAYESFVAAREKTIELGLAEFASNGEFGGLMYQMRNAFCDKYAFYVSSDEFDTIPLDEFIRKAEIGRRYYVGGTLDYHF